MIKEFAGEKIEYGLQGTGTNNLPNVALPPHLFHEQNQTGNPAFGALVDISKQFGIELQHARGNRFRLVEA